MRFKLCLLLAFFSLAACQSSPTTTPTSTPKSYLYSHTPEFSGLYLNIDPTPSGGNIYYKVVGSLEDIPGDNVVLLDKQADRVIFRCDQNYHTGTPLGSLTTYRLCGMQLDGSDQRLLAVHAGAAIVSPDHRWLIFAGDVACCSCTQNLYAMRLDGAELMNLTDTPEFANVRRCAIFGLKWQEVGDNVKVQFKAWTGKQGDYPVYSIVFYSSF